MTSFSASRDPAALECLQMSDEWNLPIFKVLASNDTGSAPGHQGGIVVPKTLARYFPEPEGSPSETSPTVETWIHAELFVGARYHATVRTRYQLQTWGATRSAERRLTGQLGSLRNEAQGGDVLVIQWRRDRPDLYRLTLVKRSSAAFAEVDRLAQGRRWGVLTRRSPVAVSSGR